MGIKEDELTILADRYNCDKGSSKHNYTKIYNKYFKDIRNKKFNMLEIGFGAGASVKMWLDYFKNINLYCIDKMKNLPNDEILNKYVESGRLYFFSADQSKLEWVLTKISDKKFKIILDDGSHISEDQQYSMSKLFGLLQTNGLYIIEDLNCKRGHNLNFKYKTDKMINILKDYNSTKKFHSKIMSEDELKFLNDSIDKIEIYYDKIAFIGKKL